MRGVGGSMSPDVTWGGRGGAKKNISEWPLKNQLKGCWEWWHNQIYKKGQTILRGMKHSQLGLSRMGHPIFLGLSFWTYYISLTLNNFKGQKRSSTMSGDEMKCLLPNFDFYTSRLVVLFALNTNFLLTGLTISKIRIQLRFLSRCFLSETANFCWQACTNPRCIYSKNII
jgi:hypothetical protein